MTAHSRAGPSRLHQVVLCRGSVRHSDGLPNHTTEAAAEGSVLHDIAAECLEFGLEPQDFIGQTKTHGGFDFTIGYGADDVDPECMVEALDWLRTQQFDHVFIERKVYLDPWMPGQFGSLDLGGYTPELLTVFDWKFGRGIMVPILNNFQVRAYCLGLLNLLTDMGLTWPKRIRLIIEQPRLAGAPRYYEPWEITLDELLAFGEFIRGIMSEIEDPNAPRHAGEKQCHFCLAKYRPGGCNEHSEFLLDLPALAVADLDGNPLAEPVLPDVGLLTPARRSYIVRHRAMIESWLKQLHAQTLGAALNGLPTPGLKAIDGNEGARQWDDPAAAEATMTPALGENTFTKKLKSPPEAEKVLKPKRGFPGHPAEWDALQKFIKRKPAIPQLVSDEDPRPARVSNVEAYFEEEPEEN